MINSMSYICRPLTLSMAGHHEYPIKRALPELNAPWQVVEAELGTGSARRKPEPTLRAITVR